MSRNRRTARSLDRLDHLQIEPAEQSACLCWTAPTYDDFIGRATYAVEHNDRDFFRGAVQSPSAGGGALFQETGEILIDINSAHGVPERHICAVENEIV